MASTCRRRASDAESLISKTTLSKSGLDIACENPDFCPLHSRASDTNKKVKAVVAQWKNYITTSIRLQAQSRASLNLNAKTEVVMHQPIKSTADVRNNQRSNVLLEELEKPTSPRVQYQFETEAVNVAFVPQSPPPSYATTTNHAALEGMLKAFQSATLQNQQLQDQNQKLRDKNAELVEKEKAAARECRRARSELGAVEDERDALEDQVDEQFQEINSLRDRAAAHRETIASLQEAVQKTNNACRRLKAPSRTTTPAVARGGM